MTSSANEPIRVKTLSNGLTLVFEAMPWLPSVAFQLLLPLGAATDPEGCDGAAVVINEWLTRGAGELDSRALSERLDGLGVRRGGGAGGEYSTLSAALLADALPETLALYADMVRRPQLADDTFESARTLALQELASLDDNPAQRMFLALSRAYFSSPHGRSSLGTAEGLRALSAEALRHDTSARLTPQGAILSVAGGVSWDDLLTHVERTLGDWTGAAPTPLSPIQREAHSSHEEAESAQVQIGVAYEAVAPGAAGWYENAVALGVLSGGMGSRLFTEVREKRGLVYSVAAVSRAVRGHGYTLGYAGTTPERAEETLSVLLDELTRVREGASDDEIERAKTGILSGLVMQGESTSARSSALARDTFLFGEPRPLHEVKETVSALSHDDINTFLANRPEPDFTIMTLGPKTVSKVGEVPA